MSRPRRLPSLLSVGVVLAAVWPVTAEAHLESTGLGPVYDGALHFLVSPADVVAVLALALYAGLRGPAHGRRALFVLPSAWLLGGAMGLATTAHESPALAPASFLLLGALVAADARLPLGATTAVAALIGFAHGYFEGGMVQQPDSGAVALLGVTGTIFVVVALGAASVVPLQAAWARMAIRVLGSWTVAIGILMVGWTLHAAYGAP